MKFTAKRIMKHIPKAKQYEQQASCIIWKRTRRIFPPMAPESIIVRKYPTGVTKREYESTAMEKSAAMRDIPTI
jgi:hypothetical protein